MCEIQINVLKWSLINCNQCMTGGNPGALIENEIVEPHYIPMELELLRVGPKK